MTEMSGSWASIWLLPMTITPAKGHGITDMMPDHRHVISIALQQNLSRGDVSMAALSQAAARLRAVDLSSAGDISGAVYDSA